MTAHDEAAPVSVGAELWLSLDGQNLAGARGLDHAGRESGGLALPGRVERDRRQDQPVRRAAARAQCRRPGRPARPGSRPVASSLCAISSWVIGGLRIIATVTRQSRDELGLAIGTKAFAVVKASSIMLMTDSGDVRLSARNQLAGSVSRVAPGAVKTEVALELPGGGSVAT